MKALGAESANPGIGEIGRHEACEAWDSWIIEDRKARAMNMA
jgi:hypothetical protein